MNIVMLGFDCSQNLNCDYVLAYEHFRMLQFGTFQYAAIKHICSSGTPKYK